MKKIMIGAMALFFMAATSGLVLAQGITPSSGITTNNPKNTKGSKKHGCHGRHCTKNQKSGSSNSSNNSH